MKAGDGMDKNLDILHETADLIKALAHPVRLCIVKGLIEKGECNVSYMQFCLDIPQSTVSQHLQKLKSAGIIEARRNGLEVYYMVCNNKAAELVKVLFN